MGILVDSDSDVPQKTDGRFEGLNVTSNILLLSVLLQRLT